MMTDEGGVVTRVLTLRSRTIVFTDTPKSTRAPPQRPKAQGPQTDDVATTQHQPCEKNNNNQDTQYIKESIDGLECGICLENMTLTKNKKKQTREKIPTSMPCGHIYCQKCLIEHLKHRKNCPKCNRDVSSEKQLRPLYIVKPLCPTCGGDDNLMIIPCGHLICSKCIKDKFQRKRCPTCSTYIRNCALINPVYF